MMTEYEYLLESSDLVGKNVDKWMAVIGREIVAVGDSAKEVLQRARDLYPTAEPFIAKFPKQTVLLL